ncbi:GNAT family N-acetyltransferase [Saccharothrix violaceirubra]|uniref:Putative N-acetyltransferase YhbS n=1 Tax=Saccharothrix violaceirubra TaxID=413306 RepID=A0A7W7WYC5_9PSEU|nr:GNAT family N-acetyltransferase [Saccharothrix violaceirubra]MBB4967876.1 putative N-acetyltransferase YhbS [Saccharothrix violaceirubra]
MTLGSVTTLRELTGDDLDACRALARSRTWPDEPDKWAFLLRVGTGFGLFDGSRLVGTVLVTRFPGHAVISMVLVAVTHERRGLGRRLMTHALEFADSPVVSLHATPNGRPLYSKLGFVAVDRVTAHVGRFTRAASGVSRPLVAADRDRVVAEDARVFGADRSGMWDGLFGFVERARVSPEGFGCAWWNLDRLMIGPVVARSVTGAAELVADLAAGDRVIRVDSRSSGLGAWLVRHGLAARATVDLMVRGEFPGDRDRLFAPVMQALG